MPRQRTPIDVSQLTKLAAMDCTQVEAAAFFDVSTTTLESRLKEPEYRAAWDRGQALGNVSLRRALVRLRKRSPAVLIFECKNRLGMSDKPATAAEPVRIAIQPTRPTEPHWFDDRIVLVEPSTREGAKHGAS